MSIAAFDINTFYDRLGFPEPSLLDKRIYKRMVLKHGNLTATDKKTLSEDVTKLTWKHALKADTVQVLPYEDAEREYLEIAVVEAMLSGRKRAPRIAEMIQRAIPYPVLLVMIEGSGVCVSVAHKRFSLAEKGSIVAEDFLLTPWIALDELSQNESVFMGSLKLKELPKSDFWAMYSAFVERVLAFACARISGRFELKPDKTEKIRRAHLKRCWALEREIVELRAGIHKETKFASQVELNAKIKQVEARLAEETARL